MVFVCGFALGLSLGAGMALLGLWRNARRHRHATQDTEPDVPQQADIQKELLRQYNNLLSYDGSVQRRRDDEN